MPTQEAPLVVLKDLEGSSRHSVWLEPHNKEDDPIDLDLRMDNGRFVPEVTDIVTARLTRSAGIPPEVEALPTGAYFAYPPKMSPQREELLWDASNTLRDLERECDGERPMEDVLEDYQRKLKGDGATPDSEMTAAEVVALKPVLRENEVKDVIADVLRQAPGNRLPDKQKETLGTMIARQLRDFPRPPVLATALDGTGNIEPEQDTLFIGIQSAVGEVVGTSSASGLLLVGQVPLQPREAYIARQLYDALQDAYKDRAGEMQR